MPVKENFENPIAIANAFIFFSLSEKRSINILKLQDLIFFTHVAYLIKNKKPLLGENFFKFKNNIYLKSVMSDFSDFEITNMLEKYEVEFIENVVILKEIRLSNYKEMLPFLNKIWLKYRDYSHKQLRTLYSNFLNMSKNKIENKFMLFYYIKNYKIFFSDLNLIKDLKI